MPYRLTIRTIYINVNLGPITVKLLCFFDTVWTTYHFAIYL
jgi:hypothetical protein